ISPGCYAFNTAGVHSAGRGQLVGNGHPGQTTVRFAEFEADFRSGELRKEGVRVNLQEQPLRILQMLMEQPGRLVTRDELQKKVCPAHTFVDFEQGLYIAVKRLREALRDSAESPRFIETLSRPDIASSGQSKRALARFNPWPCCRSRTYRGTRSRT